MSELSFIKMHGTGNDFMVIDATVNGFVPGKEQLLSWSNRHYGVGFDQLLLIEKPENKGVDFKYRIFNADGSEVYQCGNGARCFGRFVKDQGLTGKDLIKVETGAGLMQLEIMADGMVKINMGLPAFAPSQVPVLMPEAKLQYKINLDGESYEFMAASIGNPHAVFMVEDVAEFPVSKIGSLVESHQLFPQRVNAGFMQIIARDKIKLRVYERGVGETLACGSGACAAVACGIRAGLLDFWVEVAVNGGELIIEWQGEDSPIFLTGPAVSVYSGTITI